jgi:hypothetical protein
MDISVINNSISTQATTAYNNFNNRQIPFAAVKLSFRLNNTNKKAIDTIVESNFRSEKDLIFKEGVNYFIWMEGTTIETAERAVKRLKAKICHIIARDYKNLKDNSQAHASAYIFGSISRAKRLRFKYVDLISNLNSFDRTIHKIQFGYGEYLKFCESQTATNLKTINLSV